MGITLKTVKKIYAVFIILLAAVLVGFILRTIPKQVTYSDLKLPANSGLITVASKTSTTTRLITYRVDDARTEKFSGSWREIYSSPSEVTLVGSEPEHPANQYLVNLTTKSGTVPDISKLPGQINDFTISPDKKWLLLTGIKKVDSEKKEIGKHFLCVSPIDDNPMDACQLIPGDIIPLAEKEEGTPYTAYWDLDKPNTLMISSLGITQHAWNYLATNGSLTKIDHLIPISSGNPKPASPFIIKRFGPFAWIKTITKNNYQSLFWIPKNMEIIPVTDSALVLRRGSAVSVLDVRDNKMSPLATLLTLDEKITNIFTFYQPQSPVQL